MIKPIVRDMFFLGQKSVPATREDADVIRDLLDTLEAHKHECVGMAANMIGVKKQIIVFNYGDVNMAMVNPVIQERQGLRRVEEGCLSLDGVRPAIRYNTIVVEYLDRNFVKHRKRFAGGYAQIIQHEIDHLQGIII